MHSHTLRCFPGSIAVKKPDHVVWPGTIQVSSPFVTVYLWCNTGVFPGWYRQNPARTGWSPVACRWLPASSRLTTVVRWWNADVTRLSLEGKKPGWTELVLFTTPKKHILKNIMPRTKTQSKEPPDDDALEGKNLRPHLKGGHHLRFRQNQRRRNKQNAKKDSTTTFDRWAVGRSRRLVEDDLHVMLSLMYYEAYFKYVVVEGLTSLTS